MPARCPTSSQLRSRALHAIWLLCFVPRLLGQEDALELPALLVGESRLETIDGQTPGSESRTVNAASARYSLPDLLRSLPGIVTQDSFGGFEPPRISLRGSGLQSAPVSRGFLPRWNEIPLCWADLSFNTAWLDLGLTDAILAKTGPAGWSDNSGSMGGALDFRSSAGRSSSRDSAWLPLKSSLTVQSDLEHAHWLRLDLATINRRSREQEAERTSPLDRLRLQYSESLYDGFRPHSGQERRALDLRYRHASHDFDLLLMDGHYEVPGPLTLSRAYAGDWALPPPVARDQPRRDFSLQRCSWTNTTHAGEGKLALGCGLQLSQDDFRQLQANGITKLQAADASCFTEWVSAEEFLASQWTLRADLLAGTRHSRRYENLASLKGPQFGDDQLRAQTHGFLLKQSAEITAQLRLETGLRLQVTERRREDRLRSPAGDLSFDENDHRLLPSVVLRWLPAPELSLHAACTRTAEAPTFDDLTPSSTKGGKLQGGRQVLSTQTALTGELGATWQKGGNAVSLCVYDAAWNHELLRLADQTGNPLGTINAGKTCHRGVETVVTRRQLIPSGALRFSQTLVLQQLRFDRDAQLGDRRLAGAPPLQGRSELCYEGPRAFRAFVSMELSSGKTYADHAGRLSYGGATCFNAGIVLRITHYLELQASVQNFLDRRYIASSAGVLDIARTPASTALFLPAAPRRWTIGLSLTL